MGTGTAAYSLVEYVGAAGSAVVLNSGFMTVTGNMYPWGLAALSNNNIFGAASSDGTHVGSLIQFSGPPTTQATNVTFTNVLGTTATASWTNGNGSARAVFIKQVTTGNPTPVNSTTYAADPNYTTGTQIGATGWYCIYNGTGSTVNITGLTSGQTYRVMVLEYNGPAGGENYLQSTATNNPNNVSPLALTTINSINRTTPAAAITNVTSVSYTVTFGAAVTGLTSTNFSLATTGSISGAGITSVTGSGTTYTVAVNTGTGNGDLTLSLANATNLVPGLTTTLPFAGQTYTIDKTAPTISIGSPSATITRSGPISYTVTYADANFNASTLATGNITLNKTGNANGTLAVTGTGSTRTVTISGITGDGTLGITIAAGTASDLAGNTAPASGASATFTVDNTAPTVVISSTATDPTGITPIPIKLTFSENVTGFTAANVSLSPGTIANFSGSGSVYTFNITTAGFATYTVNISAAQIADLAGNTNTVAASFTILYTSPLAVQLIGFTAAEKNNTVVLNWQIAAEQNNDHYLLERSTDGIIFNALSVVQAQYGGNSSREVDYSYTDNNPLAGNDFYRLTQVDKDGKTKQLGTRVVRIGKVAGTWTVYPNPAGAHFTIALPGNQDGKKAVSIFDATGKLVYTNTIQSTAGKLAITLDKAPGAGMYTIQVEGLGATTVFFK